MDSSVYVFCGCFLVGVAFLLWVFRLEWWGGTISHIEYDPPLIVSAPRSCAACGHHRVGAFCAKCGEPDRCNVYLRVDPAPGGEVFTNTAAGNFPRYTPHPLRPWKAGDVVYFKA